MTIAIFGVNERVVIYEILFPCIVRGINIDYIDFTCMGVSEGGKCFEVVALD